MAIMCMLFDGSIDMAGDLFRHAKHTKAIAHVQGLDV